MPLNNADVFDGNKYNYKIVERLIGLNKNDLAECIGLHRSSLKPHPSQSTLKQLDSITSIIFLLWEVFKGDEGKIRAWMMKPKIEWIGFSPIAMLQRKKTDAVLDYLRRRLDPKSDLITG